jgi:hypothetical protein
MNPPHDKNRIKNNKTKTRRKRTVTPTHKNDHHQKKNEEEERCPPVKKYRHTVITKNEHSHKRKRASISTEQADLINPFLEISKTDHDATLKLLKSMDWTMAKNTSRRNVIREDDHSTPRNEMGKPYCMSFIFGRNMKDPTGSLSYWSTKYPHVYSALQNLMSKYDPNFPYTHITLNYNLQCKRHTDGGNVGPSYIAAFGDFHGGELIVEVNQPSQQQQQRNKQQGIKNKNGTTTMDKYLNLKSRFVKFNGKTQPHETAPFTGERFTLVYYTSDIVPPTVDRRQPVSSASTNHGVLTSSVSLAGDKGAGAVEKGAEILNPKSTLAQKFQAIKAKLGQRNKKK